MRSAMPRRLTPRRRGEKRRATELTLPTETSSGRSAARSVASTAVYERRSSSSQSGKYTLSLTRVPWKSPYGKPLIVKT